MTLLEKLLNQLKGTETEKAFADAGLEGFRQYMANRPRFDSDEYSKTYFRNLLGRPTVDEEGYEVSLHNHYIAFSRSQGWWSEGKDGEFHVREI